MAKNTPALRLTFTAVQGSADAFVEVAVPTGLVSVGSGAKTGIRILEIAVEQSSFAEVDSSYEVAATRKTMAAMPTSDEPSLLFKSRKQVSITTSGSIFIPDLVHRWQPQEAANIIIVEANVYIQLDSTGSSLTNAIYGYLLGEYVTVTETERLQLVAQSLGS